MIHAIKSMSNLRKGPVLGQFPLRLERTCNLHTSVTVVTVVSCFNFAEASCFCDWLA